MAKQLLSITNRDSSGIVRKPGMFASEIKRKKLTNRIIIAVIVIAVIFLIRLIFELGSFHDYSVRTHADRGASTASKFESFKDNIVEYSNDGIVYMKPDGELIWNQAFEMTSPELCICGEYILAYDRGGTGVYILNESGIVQSWDLGKTIRSADIAEQGTIAVLAKDSGDASISIYDKSGRELVAGQLYAQKGYLAVDIALSTDGQKMAIDCIDITTGGADSLVTFYNFGTVGQEEVDNKVGEYRYENTIIPEIDFVSANTMLAISDGGFIVFEGAQKPEPTRQVAFDREIESVFHNNKYVGTIYPNDDEDNSRHIKVYDMNGGSVMENKTDIPYDEVYFLNNNEVCVRGTYACEIYTITSIKKFSYTWDTEMYKILDNGVLNDYILITNGGTEQIRLK